MTIALEAPAAAPAPAPRTSPLPAQPSSGSLAFLHDDTSLLHELYDASDGLAHLAAHAGALPAAR